MHWPLLRGSIRKSSNASPGNRISARNETQRSGSKPTTRQKSSASSVWLQADDAPEVERLAVAEGLGITAAAAQSRPSSQPIQPATNDPEPIGAMPATLPA